MSLIVIADVKTMLNVRDAGMLPKLAALGVDIIIPRPVYNRLRHGSVGALIEAFTPPIKPIGPDERGWRIVSASPLITSLARGVDAWSEARRASSSSRRDTRGSRLGTSGTCARCLSTSISM
jgi:hypothetical protein